MRQPTRTRNSPGERLVKYIKRANRKYHSAEEKIRIVLDGLRADSGIHSEFIFPGRSSEKPPADLKKFWRAIITKAEIEIYCIHDNRHTHASQLVSSGMSLAIMVRLLGHTNPMTAQRLPLVVHTANACFAPILTDAARSTNVRNFDISQN